MPIHFKRDLAVFEGICRVEDAESLLAWRIKHPKGTLDLSGCEHIHSAVLQVMLAGDIPLASLPGSPRLAQVLGPLPRAANE